MFQRGISELALDRHVERLDEREAKRLAGDFFLPGVHYRVPDRVFPEAEILADARAVAISEGATFCDLTVPVTLSRGKDDHSCGIQALAQDTTVTARSVLIAAGVGTVSLLRQIGVDVAEYSATRTTISVIDGCEGLESSLLADLSNGFAVTRQGTNGSRVRGALALARKQRLPVHELNGRIAHTLTGEDIEGFWSGFDGLPLEQLRSLRQRALRYTAGIEPMRAGLPKEAKLVAALPGLPRVIFSMPGRATLSLRTAVEATKLLTASQGDGAPRGPTPVTRAYGVPWDNPIHMHFDDYYSTTGFTDHQP